MKRIVIIASVAFAVVAAGIGTWLAIRSSEEEPVGETIAIERGDLIETAATTGTIEPHVQVEVKSRTSGEVIEVLVAEGQRVAAGALLVKLDRDDAERGVREARLAERNARAALEQAEANLAVAVAQAREADANRDVQHRGVEMGLVARETERTAASSAAVAASNVALRRAQVVASRAALETARLGVDDAELRLRETEIRAPMSGTVLSVAVERGSIVSSAVTNVAGGTTLLTLADLSDLRAIGDLDESQIGDVEVGQEVVLRVDAYPDETFAGRVERVSPLGVTTTNVVTFDVEVIIDDPRASLLRSGMSADLEIVTERRTGVLLVPLTAIRSQAGQRTVRLASGEVRSIRTGATDGVRIEVLDGVEEGDELVLPSLRDNQAAPSAQSALPLGPGRRPASSMTGGASGGRGGGGGGGGPPP
jgi:HlyD family secretion protein